MLSLIDCGFQSPNFDQPPVLAMPTSGPCRRGLPPMARVAKNEMVSTTTRTGAVHSSRRRMNPPTTFDCSARAGSTEGSRDPEAHLAPKPAVALAPAVAPVPVAAAVEHVGAASAPQAVAPAAA